MDAVTEFLNNYPELTPEQRAEAIAALTDEELADLRQRLVEAADNLDDDTSAEAIDAINLLAEVGEQVMADDARREQERAEAVTRRDEARARLARLRGEGGEEEDEPGDDEPGDGGGEPADQPAEAVTASGRPRRSTPSLLALTSNRNRQRRTGHEPGDRPAPVEPAAIVASSHAGQLAGQSIRPDASAIAAALIATAGGMGPDGQRVAVSLSRPIPTERMLFRRDGALTNLNKINAVTEPLMRATPQEAESLTASGGTCAPLNLDYSIEVMGSIARPVRDALAQFGAERGGIRTRKPPALADMAGAVGVWTAAVDADPQAATKPCLRIECPDEVSATVDAVTLCIELGNVQARTDPEAVAAATQLALINQARVAENRLLTKIGALSTKVNMTRALGATRDIVANLGLLSVGFRSNRRLDDAVRLHIMLPFWVRHLVRADIVRSATDSGLPTRAVTDAEIDEMITTALGGGRVSYYLDGVAGEAASAPFPVIPDMIFAAQTSGAILGWPGVFRSYLFVDGQMLFLDGGTLDLGVIRDGDLVGTNDFKTFSETWEGVHHRGEIAYQGIHAVNPDGTAQAPIAAPPSTVIDY